MEILLEKKVQDKTGKALTGAEAIAVAVFKKALKGDIKAAEFLRDTAGQKPVEKIAFAEVDPAVIAEVERMVDGEE